jgi:hypothetical protein
VVSAFRHTLTAALEALALKKEGWFAMALRSMWVSLDLWLWQQNAFYFEGCLNHRWMKLLNNQKLLYFN